MKMSCLWGKSRAKILKTIKIENIELGPLTQDACSQEYVVYWQGIFEDLGLIFQELSSADSISSERVDKIQKNVCNVIARIRDILGPNSITPYMHVLEAHVADMIRATPFQSIGAFSCQSLELKNSHQSSVLFRQTMKGGGVSSTGIEKSHKILTDILQLELCLTFTCRNRDELKND